MKQRIKNFIKRHVKLYHICKAVKDITWENFGENEMDVLVPRKGTFERKRLNLVVPSINREHIFGGIATALKFYHELANELDAVKRIIVTDAHPSNEDLSYFPEYELIDANKENLNDNQIVSYVERQNKSLSVGKNDIFICTAWWTAYISRNIYDWQKEAYGLQNLNQFLYIIQDYEPGFYAWSGNYVLAESTYHNRENMIAVINSKILYDFFRINGYGFSEKYYFEPVFNKKLKNIILNADKKHKRKRKILFYGRPSVARNIFEVIVYALKYWVRINDESEKWELYSIGEKHGDIILNEKCKIISLGKVSLEEYASHMLDSYVGISLMVSPHPSYPPLEMSTFGMKVITNSYSNKDLSSFNENIVSIKNLDPNAIAKRLMEICDVYEESENMVMLNSEYVRSENAFEFLSQIHPWRNS